MTMNLAPVLVALVDAGDPVVILAGGHVGCYELFGTNGIRSIRELKGKTIAILGVAGDMWIHAASMVAHVGLDPRADVTWVALTPDEAMRELGTGRVDAYFTYPPFAQRLRAAAVGNLLLNTLTDRPWSQYYCCMVAAHRDYVQRYPVATARALRGLLGGVDLAGRDPDAATRPLVKGGYNGTPAEILDALRTLHSAGWRSEYDPEDTLRYYALRLREGGLIKSTPDQIIAQGTDWRFLTEVKRDRTARTAGAGFGAAASGAGFSCPLHAEGSIEV